MNELDPRYVAARRILLDALFALAPHGKAIVVAGAQAVYLRTGDADLAIAPYTKDADLAINPSLLGNDPKLEDAMRSANFTLDSMPGGHDEPGIWVAPVTINGKAESIPVDLIVPQAVAPTAGRRGARLGSHGNRAARKLFGLEAALVDHSPIEITALDPADTRKIRVEVAGVAALFVAKAHKIHDRLAASRQDRLNDKDASDTLRIMQTTSPGEVRRTMRFLVDDPVAGEATRLAIGYLRDIFGNRNAPGIEMAARAVQLVMDPDTVEVICLAYIDGLTDDKQGS